MKRSNSHCRKLSDDIIGLSAISTEPRAEITVQRNHKVKFTVCFYLISHSQEFTASDLRSSLSEF